MFTPASDGDAVVSSAALLIANDDDVKGRKKLVLVVVVVDGVTKEETKYLRAVTLHIHSANEYV
jgi:hypothetical protein